MYFFHKPQHDNRSTAINTDILLYNAVDLDQNISGDNYLKFLSINECCATQICPHIFHASNNFQ